MAQKIRVLLIFEILGRPPEYIKKALDDFIETLREKNGIEIVCKTIHEPKLLEDKDSSDLFTTFAEVEVILDNVGLLFSIVLNMLPSTIEIIQPEELKLSNFQLNSVLSELAVKLHKYDEIAKTVSVERENLINELMCLKENRIPQKIAFTMGDDSENNSAENKKEEKIKENKRRKKKKEGKKTKKK
ncbi:MAG: hypothetical protein AABX54_02155 [Nanoarchaeota archaeon]